MYKFIALEGSNYTIAIENKQKLVLRCGAVAALGHTNGDVWTRPSRVSPMACCAHVVLVLCPASSATNADMFTLAILQTTVGGPVLFLFQFSNVTGSRFRTRLFKVIVTEGRKFLFPKYP